MVLVLQGSVNNALCFIGPHRVYSQWSQTFYELCPGQGHFGPDAIPGVRIACYQTLSLFLHTLYTTSTTLPRRRSTYNPVVYQTHPGWRWIVATSCFLMGAIF